MWNQQVQRVHLNGVVNPSAPVATGDGVNSIVFSSTIFGQNFGSGTLAITYYRSQGTTLVEADVLFNTAQTWDSYRGPLQFGPDFHAIGDIRRVLLHELGHALGLNHPDSAGQQVEAVMNSTVGDRETLAADDINGIQSLYGVPAVLHLRRVFFGKTTKPGERQIWAMNGTVHSGTSSLGLVSTQWNIATSADFNGDGQVDIVWQNSVTGQRTIWLMNGATHVGSVNLPSASLDWEIVSASDFNGDGKADILWQNNATGQRDCLAHESHTVRTGACNLGVVGRRTGKSRAQRTLTVTARRIFFGRTIPMGSAQSGS